MAITYQLGFNPIWYIADNVGRPLGGGSMFTYRSLDKTQQKFVYEDPAGNFPWPDPILFDENGQQGPFYFAVDSGNPQETYYIEIYDANGNLVWTQDNYLPGGSGGGGNITEGINLTNLIINNVMWRNIGQTANPVASTFTYIAPGCHAGLAQTTSNAGPDIVFLKNNTAATDQIIFQNFLLGTQPLTGDVAPVQYLNYSCTNTPAGETQKCVQFPITSHVQNLTNETVTVTIWARGNSGTQSLVLQWFTFFGDGAGATSPLITPIETLTLTNAWQKFVINVPVPDVTGATLGGCGNDGLFLQVQFPLGSSCNIDFTKPSVYLGTIAPLNDFQLNDQIDGVLNVPRTGQVSTTLRGAADLGWVLMNDGTIGNASSNATTRANIDTFPLFNLIWLAVSNTYAPMFNSSGTPVARGANPVVDFIANNQLSLPKSLGRALSNAGMASSGGSTAWSVGQFAGEDLHVLTVGELAAHAHTPLSGSGFEVVVASGGSAQVSAGTTIQSQAQTNNTGLSQGHNTIQPTQYTNFQIKL